MINIDPRSLLRILTGVSIAVIQTKDCAVPTGGRGVPSRELPRDAYSVPVPDAACLLII